MSRAPSICAHPGCPNTKPCDKHTRKPWEGSTRRTRLPKGWDKLRRFVLLRDPLCRVCEAQGAPMPALSTEVDHIVPGDNHELDNLQGICVPHHREKTNQEAQRARQP